MSRRTIALVLAVALAALATIALISYIRGLEEEAFEGTEPVGVFVAKEEIPGGLSADTAISQGLIKQETVPAKVRPEGAIRSLEEIKGRVAGVTILKDEIIVGPRFVLPGQVKGVLPIPPDKQAISVEVDIPPGVGGFVQPGDRVSLIAQLSITGRAAGGATAQATVVKYLLQGIDVLAVGQRVVTVAGAQRQAGAAPATGRQASRVLMTLALTPAQAEQLVFAILNGELYFTLLPEGQKPVKTPGRTAGNILL